MTYAASPAPLTFDSVGDAFNRYAPVMDLGWSDWLTITQPMLDALGGGRSACSASKVTPTASALDLRSEGRDQVSRQAGSRGRVAVGVEAEPTGPMKTARTT
jgi:hypothetical protein